MAFAQRPGRKMEALRQFVNNFRFCFGFRNDHKVFADVIKSCAAVSEPTSGRALHGCVAKLGHLNCQVVSKSLLNMYAKCGNMDDCQKLFRQMGSVDPVVWNIVLSGYASSRVHDVETMRLFKAMYSADEPKPSSVTFAIVLPVCARLGDSYNGKSMHSYVIKAGLGTHTLVGNALVSMYAKCGLVSKDAYAVFDSIVDKDVVSWNAIISGFSENKMRDDAFRLFCLMMEGHTDPNYATLANILPVCAALDENIAYHSGRQIHGYVVPRSWLHTDVFVCNALVSFYLRIGRVEDAASLFGRMSLKDLISWNAAIAGYASNGEWFTALELFRELIRSGEVCPDSVTLISILPVCAHMKNLQYGSEIHAYVLRHSCLLDDTSVGNAIVRFYARFGDTNAAYWAFSLISRKDLISWNSILDAFADSPSYSHFLNLFHLFLEVAITPDSITILSIAKFCMKVLRVDKVKEVHGYSIKVSLLFSEAEPSVGNALLDAYAKCGNVEYAHKVFQGLSEKRNLVTYNSMISGYVNSGNHDNAQALFSEMSTTDLTTWSLMVRVYAESSCPEKAISLFLEIQVLGMMPNAVTIMSLLPVCAQIASLHLVRQCHAYTIRMGFGDVHLKASLLDVYAKCGNLKSACTLFQSDPHKDLVMFTAMIGGYAIHGMGKEALLMYFHMLDLGVRPDHVIITTVLSACCHAGLVDEGLQIFNSIGMAYGLKPTMEQYACVVDLLARGGRIDDAYSLVAGMPVEPNANIWGTLLGACTTYHEVELGRVVADHLLEAESNNIGNYILMSNLYAADDRWEGVLEMRKLMRKRDLKKPAGCSWVEVEGEKNVFVAGDCSHPRRDRIFEALSTLDQQIKESLQFE